MYICIKPKSKEKIIYRLQDWNHNIYLSFDALRKFLLPKIKTFVRVFINNILQYYNIYIYIYIYIYYERKKRHNYISRQACFMNRFTLQGFNVNRLVGICSCVVFSSHNIYSALLQRIEHCSTRKSTCRLPIYISIYIYIYKGYFMAAQGYKFYLWVLKVFLRSEWSEQVRDTFSTRR